MISIEQQQNLLANISRRLNKKITAYAIGGTAMMFLGFKGTTLDIDLVFDNNEDRTVFKKAIIELGYIKMDAGLIYQKKDNQPEMFKLNDERFDLFVNEVVDFIFSQSMKKRIEKTLQFNDNLVLKIANCHDIILMKCATDRVKDRDDARKIIEAKKIDWNIIIEEAKNQIRLGKHRALWNLGEFLEELKEDIGVNIPVEIIDQLWELVQAHASEHKRSPKIQPHPKKT